MTNNPESDKHCIGITSETNSSYWSGSVKVNKVSIKQPKLSSITILYVPNERLSNKILSIIKEESLRAASWEKLLETTSSSLL